MKIKVRGFARSDYESDFCKVSSQLTTEVLFEVQLVFQGVCPYLFAEHQYFLESLVALLRPGEDTRITSIKSDLKGTFTFTRRQGFRKV
ncbi:hypothetical protein Bca4012_101508 [Brassica carinata]|uniref:Uncharacterized protein n=1 Tax=Brassica carinata TaxID=52824 RepID=A0A8X7W326_BRACI|nr:hypothetical protein Bca52824_083940 [Brassica carinata]KAG2321575.1 hypothetical protein Bca52824_014788 [Brassica carinata]